jgi:hypothetical protein
MVTEFQVRAAIDVAAQRPTSRIDEGLLMRAYLHPERTVPCVCGGEISAPDGDDAAITAAVRVHNDTARHRAWRREQSA